MQSWILFKVQEFNLRTFQKYETKGCYQTAVDELHDSGEEDVDQVGVDDLQTLRGVVRVPDQNTFKYSNSSSSFEQILIVISLGSIKVHNIQS